MNKLKKRALRVVTPFSLLTLVLFILKTETCTSIQVIAEHLSVEEVAGIKEAFEMMDSNKTGKINLEQLKHGLHKLGQQQMADADLQILMEAVRKYLHFVFLLCIIAFTKQHILWCAG